MEIDCKMAKELKHFYRKVGANEVANAIIRLDYTHLDGADAMIAGIARNLEEDRPQLQN